MSPASLVAWRACGRSCAATWRLSLILAVCRSVQSTASEERVEREDVADAAKLLVYFKVHARRVFAELGSPDPLEALGSALKALIEYRGGKLEATATELYHALQEAGCEVLPAAPRELSKAVKALAIRSPATVSSCAAWAANGRTPGKG